MEGSSGGVVHLCGKVDVPKQGAEVGKDDTEIRGTDVVVGKVGRKPEHGVLEPEREELGVQAVPYCAKAATQDESVIDNVHRDTHRLESDLLEQAF